MNSIFNMTLLVAGLTGNVFVYGQVRPAPKLSPFPATPVLPGQQKRGLFLAPLAKPGFRDTDYFLKVMASDSIVLMWPDNMRCLVPSLAGIEPMPVKRIQNVHSSRGYDPMPNGFPPGQGRLWFQLIPGKRP